MALVAGVRLGSLLASRLDSLIEFGLNWQVICANPCTIRRIPLSKLLNLIDFRLATLMQ